MSGKEATSCSCCASLWGRGSGSSCACRVLLAVGCYRHGVPKIQRDGIAVISSILFWVMASLKCLLPFYLPFCHRGQVLCSRCVGKMGGGDSVPQRKGFPLRLFGEAVLKRQLQWRTAVNRLSASSRDLQVSLGAARRQSLLFPSKLTGHAPSFWVTLTRWSGAFGS